MVRLGAVHKEAHVPNAFQLGQGVHHGVHHQLFFPGRHIPAQVMEPGGEVDERGIGRSVGYAQHVAHGGVQRHHGAHVPAAGVVILGTADQFQQEGIGIGRFVPGHGAVYLLQHAVFQREIQFHLRKQEEGKLLPAHDAILEIDGFACALIGAFRGDGLHFFLTDVHFHPRNAGQIGGQGIGEGGGHAGTGDALFQQCAAEIFGKVQCQHPFAGYFVHGRLGGEEAAKGRAGGHAEKHLGAFGQGVQQHGSHVGQRDLGKGQRAVFAQNAHAAGGGEIQRYVLGQAAGAVGRIALGKGAAPEGGHIVGMVQMQRAGRRFAAHVQTGLHAGNEQIDAFNGSAAAQRVGNGLKNDVEFFVAQVQCLCAQIDRGNAR